MHHWITACCLLAVGCASPPATWREVSTPHFTLRTDLDAPTAVQAGAALETTRDAILSAAWSGVRCARWASASPAMTVLEALRLRSCA